MIAEVASDHAVPWTQPADWEVDLNQPLAALRQLGRSTFLTGFADGHAKAFDQNVNVDEFCKLLTRAGGEVVDYEKL